ncbi:hypothetical protein L2E82_36581 [Cichorium intybus]|uniref:Uncharacterized protein n=1 Tax=Cichorium intybus TaxID=13427 RepID=A0ACB9AC16_CICIN|nr:hypothetical protein L2E82_36581 [Cichorium intybus]
MGYRDGVSPLKSINCEAIGRGLSLAGRSPPLSPILHRRPPPLLLSLSVADAILILSTEDNLPSLASTSTPTSNNVVVFRVQRSLPLLKNKTGEEYERDGGGKVA